MTAPALDGVDRNHAAPVHRLAGSSGHSRQAAAAASRAARTDQVAARLAQAIAEVLVRARPASQLERHATRAVVRLLERRADPPVLATARAVPRPTITSLRLCHPRSGAVEVAAVVCVGRRHRAIAFRMEAVGPTWICVAVQVG